MAEGKRVFKGMPAGAVFEASQRALRGLDLEISDEDHARRQINAERKKTFWKEQTKIDLWVSEIGQTSEVRVKKYPKELLDVEGKGLVNSILSEIEIELQKIKAEGRISQENIQSQYNFGETPSAKPSEGFPEVMQQPKASREKDEAKLKSGGSLSFLQIIGVLLIVHFFFGWEWLGNLTSGKDTETRAQEMIATLNAYAQVSPNSIDLVDLGRRVPDMTDVQVTGLEDDLKGTLVAASGPIYDVQAARSSLDLVRFEVVVWAMTINPVRLPVRGTCIARNSQEASRIERLTVGQNVRITGEVRSVGRTLGIRLRNCIVELA